MKTENKKHRNSNIGNRSNLFGNINSFASIYSFIFSNYSSPSTHWICEQNKVHFIAYCCKTYESIFMKVDSLSYFLTVWFYQLFAVNINSNPCSSFKMSLSLPRKRHRVMIYFHARQNRSHRCSYTLYITRWLVISRTFHISSYPSSDLSSFHVLF